MKRLQNLSDWKITRNKKEYPGEGLTHALWETEDEVYALYFYNIGEYGILKTCSSLQILKDKLNPQIVYDSQKSVFDYDPFDESFLKQEWNNKQYIVLRQLLFNPFRALLVLINLETMEFFSWNKFFVEFKINNDNTIRLTEMFIDKSKNVESTVDESYNFNDLEWKFLSKLTS